jgi:hypothetical protein
MTLNIKFGKPLPNGPIKAQFKLSTFPTDFHDIDKSFDKKVVREFVINIIKEIIKGTIYDVEEGVELYQTLPQWRTLCLCG